MEFGGGRNVPFAGCYRRHHRHVFYVSVHCPFHRRLLQPSNHSPRCSFSEPYAKPSIELDRDEIRIELDDGGEEEEEEAVFVLTDEWRDFFAKSEANRNLQDAAKKKGKKNKMQGS